MQKRGLWHYSRLILLSAFLVVASAPAVLAETSSSSHYQVTESQFGSSSGDKNCSSQYCAQAGLGSAAAGSSAGSGNTVTFGSITGSDPLLEVIVTNGDSNLGTFTAESTSTKTMIVKIRNYLSSGYVLQITGSPPKIANHTLHALTSPAASTPGTEQFGINAADNTTPNIGAAPLQVPSSQTSFGVVNDDYKTADRFMYVSGDNVAHSAKSSGETDYTISMIVNVSNSTPAGSYASDFSAVVIPVY